MPASYSAYAVLGVLLAAGWVSNLYVVEIIGNEPELYPMSAYPMFSTSKQTVADDYRFVVQADAGSPTVTLEALDMFNARHGLEPSPSRALYSKLTNSVLQGCAGARGQQPCTGDSADFHVPPAYAARWTAVARARLGLSHDPYSLTFVQVLVPVDQVGEPNAENDHAIFTYYSASGETKVHATSRAK